MSKALFFLDSNAVTGLGHFSRCLNIARHLRENQKDLEIIFSGDLDLFSQSSLNNFGFIFKKIDTPFSSNLEISPKHINIFDSYQIEQNFIDHVCKKPNHNFFVDDFGKLDYSKAAGVINFTIAPSYPAENSAKKMLLGPNYFPYKPEIRSIRERSKQQKIRNILVFISNSKVDHILIEKALELISGATRESGANLLLITSDTQTTNTAERLGYEIKPPTSNVEVYYEWADLIISGGGLVKYESSYCLIPIVSFSLNKGQENDSRLLSEKGLIKYLGPLKDLLDPKSFVREENELKCFLQDRNQITSQQNNQQEVFHRDSGQNLAKEIISG